MQFEAAVSVEKISELYLVPALQQLFDILPIDSPYFRAVDECLAVIGNLLGSDKNSVEGARDVC